MPGISLDWKKWSVSKKLGFWETDCRSDLFLYFFVVYYFQSQVHRWFQHRLKSSRSFFEEKQKKVKIKKHRAQKKTQNYGKKKTFGSEITVQTQLRKKKVRVQDLKSIQNAFKTIRNYVTFYVKRKDFSRSEMAWLSWFRVFYKEKHYGA